jgi:hypothetical protein
LFGNIGLKIITITEKMNKGFYIPDYAYLHKGKKHLIFLKIIENEYKITNGLAGVFPFYLQDDILKIINKNTSRNNLFSKESIEYLINLFYEVNSEKIKSILLYDLKNVITKNNNDFIEACFNSNSKGIKIFGIEQAGRTQNLALKSEIEKLIINNNDPEYRFYGIIALRDYGDEGNINLLTSFLNDKKKAIRKVAIEALGNIRSNRIIEPSMKTYKDEDDFVNRITIIESLIKLKDKKIIINSLKELRKMENNQVVLNILDRNINK